MYFSMSFEAALNYRVVCYTYTYETYNYNVGHFMDQMHETF